MRRLTPLASPRSIVYVGLLTALSLAGFTGCSKKPGKAAATESSRVQLVPVIESDGDPAPQGGVVTVASGRLPLPSDSGDRIKLPTGDYIPIETIRGVSYVTVQAALAEASFKSLLRGAAAQSLSQAELKARLELPLQKAVDALAAQVDGLEGVRFYPEIGFFVAQMQLARFEQLGSIQGLPADLVLNPVVISPIDERFVRKMDESLVNAVLAGVSARDDSSAFSGLKRMGVPEFLALVQEDLGQQTVDGSQVRVGVTDTGITYNHPTFADADGNPRIDYMRDFTGEGRIYFHPEAKFEVESASEEAETLHLKAQVLPPVTGALAQPRADDLKEVEVTIQPSAELRQILLSAKSGAKLGVLSEASFASDAEKVDLNLNGKTDDQLHAILVPAAKDAYKLYLDVTGDYDFRKATAIGSFNPTKDTLKLVSERFGFDIAAAKLKDSAGKDVGVIGASIVGFDPGNHGSHVSGIIAGRKTISNDDDATFARGVAPNARLMVNRVCANNGGCNATEAVIDLARNGAEIINMSLGGLSPYNDGYGVQEVVIDRLSDLYNVLFVISAGNSGPGINTVGSPSTARSALSVGAAASRSLIERQYQWPGTGKVDAESFSPAARDVRPDDDFMLFFSSRGPTAAGGFKPNIAAPGTELSSIQLNAAPGARAGLDVYWGTSMAAPSAAGAITLLIDAAKRYNALHPSEPLPLDSQTLRRVVTTSARPFDVTRYEPDTGHFTRGQYTWIDQGTGMIDLPRAWEALKQARKRIASGVYAVNENGTREDIEVDYQVRVLRKSPNGINYDGSIELPPDMFALTGPRFGRGIWLDAKGLDQLIPVQIARRLPYSAASRSDVGDLKTRLVTSADKFSVRTVIYGSNQVWLSAGTLNSLDCDHGVAPRLDVIGEGAFDNFEGEVDRSSATRDSTLYVCINRAILETLPAGDHGALIELTRIEQGEGAERELLPSITVPVYVTIPQKTLAGAASYKVTGTIEALGVARHYVRVPEGTSLVSVKIEVPVARVSGTAVAGCQGVRLYAYEAGNSSTPQEIAGDKSIARNCDDAGVPSPDLRTVAYVRTNPKAGIWDLHVLGRYQFPKSEYTLTVEYAKVEASVAKIAGEPTVLDGALDFKVLDASFVAEPSAERTTLTLAGLAQSVNDKLAADEKKLVADLEGHTFRRFSADIAAVEFATGGSAGNDVDLYVLECAEANAEACSEISSSTSATDVESVVFTPKKDKFYAASVVGYSMERGDGSYVFTETRRLAKGENAAINIEALAERQWRISYDFDHESSELLKRDVFLAGKYQLVGSLTIRTATGDVMSAVPVEVKAVTD